MEKETRIRTSLQNKCLHKLFSDVANEMLAQGIERRTVVNDLAGYSCPVDASFLKDVWKAVMYTQTGLQSTTAMNTSQVQTVYDTFHRFISENYGIHCPWPTLDAMYAHEWYDEHN